MRTSAGRTLQSSRRGGEHIAGKNIIKEYLVKLGVQDNFTQSLDNSMKKASNKVSRFVGNWGKLFFLAGSAVVTATVMANVGVAKFIGNLAKADDELEEFARTNGLTREEAFKTKSALDAMGKSMEEIQASPRLLQQYRELRENASNLQPPDMSEGLEKVRAISGEYTKLKQIGGAALQWIGHYTLKYMAGPLETVHEKMGGINETLMKNLPAWSEKVGVALSWIVRLGMTLIRGAGTIFNAIKKIFDMIPKEVKIASSALSALALFIRAGPIGKLITILSLALLLLEDFFTYMDGDQSLLAPLWEMLAGLFDGFTEGGRNALDFFLKDFIPKAVQMVGELGIQLLQAILPYLPVLLDTGTEILMALIAGIAGMIPELVNVAILLMEKLLGALFDGDVLDQILEAGTNLVFSLLEGLMAAMPDIARAAVSLLTFLISAILQYLPKLIQTGIDLVLSLMTGILNALPDIVKSVVELMSSLLSTILAHLPELIVAGIEILVALIAGIIQAVPQLIAAIPEIVAAIMDGLSTLPGQLLELGITLVKSLWSGVTSMGSWLKGKVTGFFSGIWDGVKGAFSGGGGSSGGGDPSTSGAGMPGHADGGIFGQEHVARFAENNEPEAVVPLNKPNRAREVMSQIGQFLGGGSAPSLESVEKLAGNMNAFVEKATELLSRFDATLNAGAAAAAAAGSAGSVVYNQQKYDLSSSTRVYTNSDRPQEVATAVDRTQQNTIRNLKDVVV